jgi:hypothetical protein
MHRTQCASNHHQSIHAGRLAHLGVALLAAAVPTLLLAQAPPPKCIDVSIPVYFGLGLSAPGVSTSIRAPDGTIGDNKDQKELSGAYTVTRLHNRPTNLCPGAAVPTLPDPRQVRLTAVMNYELFITQYDGGFVYTGFSLTTPGGMLPLYRRLNGDATFTRRSLRGSATTSLDVNGVLGTHSIGGTLTSGYDLAGFGFDASASGSAVVTASFSGSPTLISDGLEPTFTAYEESVIYSLLVPEPSTIALLSTGLTVVGLLALPRARSTRPRLPT